ncbi:hypothetical protein V1525DRAFT_409283 [Lipomyces kononenkoae]|uniref:Uncharacterized protein n=1 Tax=Lipomyces kononenkoae TaxID=34357 RepID=A0ACC3SVK2_LIPKO
MPSSSSTCAPTVISSLTAHFSSPREYRQQYRTAPSSSPSSSSSVPSASFRNITSAGVRSDLQVDEEYSADFSPESFTKRLFFRNYTTAPPTQTPLLPATPCVPVRPLDTNKGYPLPTNCFADIDWIAEYNSNNAYTAVLTPPECPNALPRTIPTGASSSTVCTLNQSSPLKQQPKLPSVTNSLVQTDIDGDDSKFWYKSTTRFASPEDEWDYERLRRRIREYTSANKSGSSVISTGQVTREGLGPAAAVNETVRRTAVRRLKSVLAHLTGADNPDTVNSASDSCATDDMGLDSDQIDIGRLRMAIEELSGGSSEEWTHSGSK